MVGEHALLSPSYYHWLNYSEGKLIQFYQKNRAAQRGTELHEFAQRAITLGIKLPKNHITINEYVNDAIGYGMVPEQVLFFSPHAFGTADAISFKRNFLRIHDLKTGESPTSMNQLKIYAAFFCLEYDVVPENIDMEFRIYQKNEVKAEIGEHNEIAEIMELVKRFDWILNGLESEREV